MVSALDSRAHHHRRHHLSHGRHQGKGRQGKGHLKAYRKGIPAALLSEQLMSHGRHGLEEGKKSHANKYGKPALLGLDQSILTRHDAGKQLRNSAHSDVGSSHSHGRSTTTGKNQLSQGITSRARERRAFDDPDLADRDFIEDDDDFVLRSQVDTERSSMHKAHTLAMQLEDQESIRRKHDIKQQHRAAAVAAAAARRAVDRARGRSEWAQSELAREQTRFAELQQDETKIEKALREAKERSAKAQRSLRLVEEAAQQASQRAMKLEQERRDSADAVRKSVREIQAVEKQHHEKSMEMQSLKAEMQEAADRVHADTTDLHMALQAIGSQAAGPGDTEEAPSPKTVTITAAEHDALKAQVEPQEKAKTNSTKEIKSLKNDATRTVSLSTLIFLQTLRIALVAFQ